jgi:hypothetical protein
MKKWQIQSRQSWSRFSAFLQLPQKKLSKAERVSPCCINSVSLLTNISSEKYLKKLVGRTDIEDALKRLDKLTQEEARMATAQVLKITHTVDDRVARVTDKVLDVDDRVAGVDDRVKAVDDKVAAVIDGVQYTFNQ